MFASGASLLAQIVESTETGFRLRARGGGGPSVSEFGPAVSSSDRPPAPRSNQRVGGGPVRGTASPAGPGSFMKKERSARRGRCRGSDARVVEGPTRAVFRAECVWEYVVGRGRRCSRNAPTFPRSEGAPTARRDGKQWGLSQLLSGASQPGLAGKTEALDMWRGPV